VDEQGWAGDDALRGLADRVRVEVAAAGLPILPADPSTWDDTVSGVEVSIDDGRVWVAWRLRGPLRDAALRAFTVGAYRLDETGEPVMHPALRHRGTVMEALGEALTTILLAVGYGVREGVNDFDPDALLIDAPGETRPHWRDPAVPPLAGSAGYAPGVRVRLLRGDFAGATTTIYSATHQFPSQGPPSRYRLEHPAGDGFLDVDPADVTLADET
jgi:hypothetical protein